MYYENFEKLCKEKNVKPATVSKATGVATSTLSNWKKDGYTPKQSTLQPIADYFNVSIDYLMTGKEPETKEYSSEAAHLVAKIRNDTELSKALLKYFELSDVKKKHVVELINLLSGE